MHRRLKLTDESFGDFPFTPSMGNAEYQASIPGFIRPKDAFAVLIKETETGCRVTTTEHKSI